MERDLDLTRYSDAVLELALRRIDRERHPQNYQRMAAELARRRGMAQADGDGGGPPSHPVDPPAAAAAAQPAVPAGPVRYRPEFAATAGEYFRIWIVNLALTIVTLGIYSAWAKVRRLRYFHGSTMLAGSAFAYHGEPLKILKGRAVASLLFGLYVAAGQVSPLAGLAALVMLGLATPWLVVKSRIFSMRMTSWRGMRFDFAEDYRGAYKALLGAGVLAVLTLGLLLPRFIRERYRFVLSRTRFGRTEFGCEPPTWPFYRTSMLAGLMMMGIGVVAAMALGFIGVLVMSEPGGGQGGAQASPAANLLVSLVALLVYVPAIAVFYGYTQSRNLNTAFNATTIGPHRLVSQLSARRMIGLYLGNTLAILLTLGLATPWAVVRLARYRLESVELEAQGSLEAFLAATRPADATAAGEEISGFFDVDFGL